MQRRLVDDSGRYDSDCFFSNAFQQNALFCFTGKVVAKHTVKETIVVNSNN